MQKVFTKLLSIARVARHYESQINGDCYRKRVQPSLVLASDEHDIKSTFKSLELKYIATKNITA